MRFNVINIYRYPEIARKQHPETKKDQKDLYNELCSLESMAKAIRKYHMKRLPRSHKHQYFWNDFFRYRLSPDAPREIRAGEKDWYRQFLAAAQRDHELLSNMSSDRTDHVDYLGLLDQMKSHRANKSFTLTPEDLEVYVPLGEKVLSDYLAHYRGRPPQTGHYDKYYLEATISDIFSRLELENLTLRFVKVTDFTNGMDRKNQPHGRVSIFQGSSFTPAFSGAVLHLQVRHRRNPSKMMQAYLIFWQNASDGKKHQSTQLNGQIQSAEFCERIAAVLIHFLESTKHLPWEIVWSRIISYTEDCPDPTLLGTLVQYRPYLEKLPGKSVPLIAQKLPLLIQTADWSSIRQNLCPILTIVKGKSRQRKQKFNKKEYYIRVYQQCPKEASVGDIRFLTQIARVLKLKLNKYSSFAFKAVMYNNSEEICQRCRELMQLNITKSEAKECLKKIEKDIMGFIKDVDREGKAAEVVKDLDPLFKAGEIAGIPLNDLKTNLAEFLAYYPQIPIYTPGLWHTRDQIQPFLGILEALLEVISSGGKTNSWNMDRLDHWLQVLPASSDRNEYPSRYPTSLWPLIQNWLLDKKQGSREYVNYYLDVARECILHPVKRTSQFSADVKDIAKFSAWLHEENTTDEVYRSVIQLMWEQFEYATLESCQTNVLEEMANALIAFISPDPDHKEKLSLTMKLLIEMKQKGIDAARCPQKWCYMLCKNKKYNWEKEFIPLLVSCLLTDGSDLGQKSIELLQKFNYKKISTDEIDRQLSSFEHNIWSAESLTEHLIRLRAFACWLSQNKISLFNRWDNWFHLCKYKNEDISFQRKRLLIMSACLLTNEKTILQQRIQMWLWPSVPKYLIIEQKSENQLRWFIKLVKDSSVKITYSLNTALAKEVLSNVNVSNKGGTRSLQLKPVKALIETIVPCLSPYWEELVDSLSVDEMIHLVKILTCLPSVSLSELVRNELWSIATLYHRQPTDRSNKLVNLASRAAQDAKLKLICI